jgi:hypothetical protein
MYENELPAYTYPNIIDNSKPIPPAIISDEYKSNPSLKKNHLQSLAQMCANYSREFESVIGTVRTNIPSLLSPQIHPSNKAKYEINDENSESVYKLKNSSMKKKKKKKKKSKKSLKKEDLSVITSESEVTILNKKLMKLEEYRSNEEVLETPNRKFIPQSSSSSPKQYPNKPKHRFQPYEVLKSPNTDVFKRPSVNSFKPSPFACNWMLNGMVCGAGFNSSEELNEHIKFHTTNELLTDLNFYYRTKALLSNQLNSPNAATSLELNPYMSLYLNEIKNNSPPTTSSGKGLLIPTEYAKKSTGFGFQKP